MPHHLAFQRPCPHFPSCSCSQVNPSFPTPPLPGSQDIPHRLLPSILSSKPGRNWGPYDRVRLRPREVTAWPCRYGGKLDTPLHGNVGGLPRLGPRPNKLRGWPSPPRSLAPVPGPERPSRDLPVSARGGTPPPILWAPHPRHGARGSGPRPLTWALLSRGAQWAAQAQAHPSSPAPPRPGRIRTASPAPAEASRQRRGGRPAAQCCPRWPPVDLHLKGPRHGLETRVARWLPTGAVLGAA